MPPISTIAWDGLIGWDDPILWDGLGFVRRPWVLADPVDGSIYAFEINPLEGGPGTYTKHITEQSTLGPGGKTLVLEGADPAKKIEFSGTLLSETQHDAFLAFWEKRRRVKLTDDLGRKTWVYLVDLEATRKRVASNSWKHEYKVSAIVLGQA